MPGQCRAFAVDHAESVDGRCRSGRDEQRTDRMTAYTPRPADGADVLKALREAAAKRILVLDGAMGTEIQTLELLGGGFPRRALQGLEAGPQGQQRPADPDAARRGARRPSRLFPRRRRHRRDQHLLRHLHRPGRLRHGGDRLRAEPRGRAPCPRGRADSPRRRTAAAASSPAPSARPTARSRSRRT